MFMFPRVSLNGLTHLTLSKARFLLGSESVALHPGKFAHGDERGGITRFMPVPCHEVTAVGKRFRYAARQVRSSGHAPNRLSMPRSRAPARRTARKRSRARPTADHLLVFGECRREAELRPQAFDAGFIFERIGFELARDAPELRAVTLRPPRGCREAIEHGGKVDAVDLAAQGQFAQVGKNALLYLGVVGMLENVERGVHCPWPIFADGEPALLGQQLAQLGHVGLVDGFQRGGDRLASFNGFFGDSSAQGISSICALPAWSRVPIRSSCSRTVGAGGKAASAASASRTAFATGAAASCPRDSPASCANAVLPRSASAKNELSFRITLASCTG